MKGKSKLPGKKSFTTILTILIFVMTASPASSYVLTGSQLLELVVARLGKAKSLYIKQKFVLYDDTLENGSVEFDETVIYQFPELFRSEITSQDTKKIHVASFEQAMVILDGQVASEFESGFDHYKDLLLFKDRMMLQKRLQLLGLDTGKTRIERVDDRIAYVIGQKEDDGDIFPQLYLDKKTFLPFKWTLRGSNLLGEETVPLEIMFYDWKKYRKARYPGRIEFYQNNMLVREIRVEKVGVNIKIDEKLFDFEALKTEFSAPDVSDKKTEKTEKKSETREKIDGLDKIIENDQLAF